MYELTPMLLKKLCDDSNFKLLYEITFILDDYSPEINEAI